MVQHVLKIITRCPEDTRLMGEKIGKSITDGLIIGLTGELGSGKTTLVQGLARGLAVPDDQHITSPTYTIINEYPGRIPLFHVDLYRLEGQDAFEDIGLYDILDSEGVVVIEWADKLQPVVQFDHFLISFKTLSEQSRSVHFTAYGEKAVALLERITPN